MARFLKSLGDTAKSLLRDAAHAGGPDAEKVQYVAQLWQSYKGCATDEARQQALHALLPLVPQHCGAPAAFHAAFGEGPELAAAVGGALVGELEGRLAPLAAPEEMAEPLGLLLAWLQSPVWGSYLSALQLLCNPKSYERPAHHGAVLQCLSQGRTPSTLVRLFDLLHCVFFSSQQPTLPPATEFSHLIAPDQPHPEAQVTAAHTAACQVLQALGPFAASPVALADLAATHTLELLFVAASGQTATPVDAHTEVHELVTQAVAQLVHHHATLNPAPFLACHALPVVLRRCEALGTQAAALADPEARARACGRLLRLLGLLAPMWGLAAAAGSGEESPEGLAGYHTLSTTLVQFQDVLEQLPQQREEVMSAVLSLACVRPPAPEPAEPKLLPPALRLLPAGAGGLDWRQLAGVFGPKEAKPAPRLGEPRVLRHAVLPALRRVGAAPALQAGLVDAVVALAKAQPTHVEELRAAGVMADLFALFPQLGGAAQGWLLALLEWLLDRRAAAPELDQVLGLVQDGQVADPEACAVLAMCTRLTKDRDVAQALRESALEGLLGAYLEHFHGPVVPHLDLADAVFACLSALLVSSPEGADAVTAGPGLGHLTALLHTPTPSLRKRAAALLRLALFRGALPPAPP
eukprot:EG_transcript_6418